MWALEQEGNAAIIERKDSKTQIYILNGGFFHCRSVESLIFGGLSGTGRMVFDASMVDCDVNFEKSVYVDVLSDLIKLLSEIYGVQSCYILESVENRIMEDKFERYDIE